jgi:hypothetical protein
LINGVFGLEDVDILLLLRLSSNFGIIWLFLERGFNHQHHNQQEYNQFLVLVF